MNGYFGARFPGATVDIVDGKTKVKEDGSFKMDLGPANKETWTYVIQNPEGGSNMTDVSVVVEGGKFVLKGKLIDKKKPGKVLVVIDPPSYYLLGGFDDFLLVIPEGEPIAWGDLDCDGGSDSTDAILILLHLAGIGASTPAGGCPSVGTEVYADGLERPWGDLDCSGEITFRDALMSLQSEADMDTFQAFECPPIGLEVTLTLP